MAYDQEQTSLHELETETFRAIIMFRQPRGRGRGSALNVPEERFCLRLKLYKSVVPQVKRALSDASSRTHISFNGRTTKGGRSGFFAVIAHFLVA